jgi:CRP/FNR family nitrogen fixation transcriptional regulator
MVRRCRVLANGRRQILSFNLPGDIFSMALDHRHSASAEAVTNASVMFVERRRLLSLADSDSGAAQALLGVMMRNHDDMQEHMLSLTRSAESRLARFPLQYSARLQCRPQLSLPMTLRDIADHLELTLETVGRTLNGLKCSGMIERAGPRQISVRDRAALECLGE